MKLFTIYSFILLAFFFSCSNDVKDQQLSKADSLQVNMGTAKIFEPIQDEHIIVLEKDGITLTEIKSQNSEDISINLITKQFKEGENDINFKVDGVDDYSIAIIENN